jgi:hypothetical protein
LVTKIEGATMDCKNCDSELICRLKDYGGDYKSTLQWQNYDGTAHYKTTDGKNFNCNIPEEEGETKQTHIPSAPSTPSAPRTPRDPPQIQNLINLENKIDVILQELELTKAMVEPLFKKMVDEQIGRVDE